VYLDLDLLNVFKLKINFIEIHQRWFNDEKLECARIIMKAILSNFCETLLKFKDADQKEILVYTLQGVLRIDKLLSNDFLFVRPSNKFDSDLSL
jgi:hypothetical protein